MPGEYRIDISGFPKGAQKRIRAVRLNEPEKYDGWKAERLACLSDPLFLGEVLGMDFQENPHRLLFDQFVRMRPLDGVALSDLSTEFKKFMILWSRGVFKTSAVIVWIILLILNYPNIRICFLTGGDQLAKRQLRRVKQMFEKPTQRFLDLFPEFCTQSQHNKKDAKWEDEPAKIGNAHEFTVPCRSSVTFAEPTFAISTAKSVKAGSHFDLIFIDDLVNEQNYRSVKLLEKCYQDYLDICPLLDPGGFILMTGTRYSYGDTYERIQETAKEEEAAVGHSVWKFSIRDCWSYGCKNCEHSSVYHDKNINIIQPPCMTAGCGCIGYDNNAVKGVLFPAVRTRDGRTIGHTLDFLENAKIQLGPEFFANQYENNPIATGSQTFSDADLDAQTFFHEQQIPKYNESFTFFVGDLAYVGQSGRDYSVVYVCRLHEGQIFVFDCIFGNWDSGAIAEKTIETVLKYRPSAIYYEKFNGWEAYNTIIVGRAAQKNLVNLPLQWIKGSQAPNAKLARIGSIKEPLKSKRLWIYAAMPAYSHLRTQLTRWPKLGKHDDFADTLGMVVSAPTGWQAIKPPTAESTLNWLQRLHMHSGTSTSDDNYPDTGMGNGIIG